MHLLTPAVNDGHDHSRQPLRLTHHVLARRHVLGASAAMAGVGLCGRQSPACAQQTPARATPEQVIGPFYPLRLPADQDADLTFIVGRATRAQGTTLYLSGRVTNARGEPVPDAELELWQANAVGRYNHPADENPLPIDANFEGYAKVRTDAEGRYRIKTIKPGAYPATPAWMRPPHIHFDVRGRQSRLVTQMYFEGEEHNAKDRFIDRLSPSGKDALMARYGTRSAQQEADALVAVWNVVLIAG